MTSQVQYCYTVFLQWQYRFEVRENKLYAHYHYGEGGRGKVEFIGSCGEARLLMERLVCRR